MSASDTPEVPRTIAFAQSVKGTPLDRYWSAIGHAEQLERELSAYKILREGDKKDRDHAERQLADTLQRTEGLLTALQTIADSHDSPDNDSIAREALAAYRKQNPVDPDAPPP